MAHWPPKRDRKGFKWVWAFRGETDDKSRRIIWTAEPRKEFSFHAPGFNDRLMRKGDRFVMPLTASTTYPLIGAVALHWGSFETQMDKLLASFVAADGDPDDEGWQRRPFKKRRELLKTKAQGRFPGRIGEEIARVLEAAAVYHWQRNLVIHGHFVLHAKGTYFVVSATGMVHGRNVELTIEDAHLERMYHEIAFLTGRFEGLTAKGGREWLSLRDRSRLRAFLRKHPWNPPTSQKIAAQHPPLRVLSLLHRKPPVRRQRS